jgi:hypothetical protein
MYMMMKIVTKHVLVLESTMVAQSQHGAIVLIFNIQAR